MPTFEDTLNRYVVHNVSIRNSAAAYIKSCTPFDSNGVTLWARWFECGAVALKAERPKHGGRPSTLGPVMDNQLPLKAIQALENVEGNVFVVFSYNTPIAWCERDFSQFQMPDCTYTTTTHRHQAQVRKGAWRVNEFPC